MSERAANPITAGPAGPPPPISPEAILAAWPRALERVELPGLSAERGKVRDIFRLGSRRILVATDRLSAFDRVLGLVPFKGQVLNQLAAYWFEATRDLVPNHLLEVPDPNVTVAAECRAYPVEVVVRGYITGVTATSLWYAYQRGERVLYGHRLPEGLAKNEPLPGPLITPTTRATGPGGHDEPLSPSEVVSRGLVDGPTWERIQEITLALFRRGMEICARAGLILVDTKYEFGELEGQPVLIDEVHTPDSSRLWLAASYESRLAAGEEPESLDKELLRRWFVSVGYRGQGPPPALPEELVVEAAQRYAQSYTAITGRAFQPAAYPAGPRIRAALREAGSLREVRSHP